MLNICTEEQMAKIDIIPEEEKQGGMSGTTSYKDVLEVCRFEDSIAWG